MILKLLVLLSVLFNLGEGVPLVKMPVTVESDPSVDFNSSESCVKLMTSKDEVAAVKCPDNNTLFCFKTRKTAVGCGTRDKGYSYDKRTGSCYKFHRKGLTWRNAYMKCKQEGGYLAVINSRLEHKVLLELFARNPGSTITDSNEDYASIGFRDCLDGESWRTVKGQTLEAAGFNVWAPGEPSNGGGKEHCGSMYRQGNLNDATCYETRAFICEKDEILYE